MADSGRMAALARVRARWRRPSLSWLAAVVLLLLLLCSPAARARRIEYFDLESRPLPLPNPPGLVLGPMGNNTLRETRDIVVLADGASNARPMRAWDAAVLRTFVVKEGYRQFLTLLNARDERVFHVDLGTIEFDLNQKRISSGDFNGDAFPDLAIGLIGAVEILYLQDSADDPILDRHRIEYTDGDLSFPDWVPFTTPDQPFTQWPVRLLSIPDMDGNGIDELWTSTRFYQSLDGEYVGMTAQLLFLQAPRGSSPLLYAAPITREHFPQSNRTFKGSGSIVSRIGDRNGDGYEDVIVSAGRDCEGVDFFVLNLQPNYSHPILRSYPVTLTESAGYWLRGCRQAERKPVEIGFGTSTAVEVRASPIMSPRPYNLALKRMGDINGNGQQELMVQYVSLSPAGNEEKSFILTPTADDYSQLTLLCFMAPPETTDQGFSRWGFATVPMPKTAHGGAPPEGGGGDKLLQPTTEEAYVFRVYQGTAEGPDMGLHLFTLPLPMMEKVPLKVVEEAKVLVFKQPGYDLNQALNIILAALGFICACICIAHLLRAQREARGLVSLLVYMELWLFFFNAIYSGVYFVYALATIIFTHMHGLIRAYSLNEYEADPRFFLLKKWARRNQHAVFWLQQLSFLPGFWHMALAWALYKYLACGRSPAVLERQVRGRVWWAVVLFVTALAVTQAGIFYARGGKFGPAHMAVHLTINTVLFVVITLLYGRTLVVYVRRYGLKRTGRQWQPEESPQEQWRRQRSRRRSWGKPRQHAALWRLVLLLAFFEATWLLVILNDFRSTHRADFLEPPMGDAPSTFMAVADAVILGSVIGICWRNRFWWHALFKRGHGQQQAWLQQQQQQQQPGAAKRAPRASLASVSMGTRERLSRGRQRAGAGTDITARIFATTYNLGSAGRDVSALGALEAWIPLEFDLYVIGLQECPTTLLDDLKRAVHAHVGGAGAYTLYENDVWSTNGEIALLVLARQRDVDSGAFDILGGLFNRVNLGVSVGVWRLPNKAAVGLACRLHDRALALVTAHFAADKHGRERPEARVRDAVRSLKELSLGHESEEVDLQLAFHHVIIVGDLNFRVRLPPNAVVQKVAAAVDAEQGAFRHQCLIRPPPSAGGGTRGVDVVASWRLNRQGPAVAAAAASVVPGLSSLGADAAPAAAAVTAGGDAKTEVEDGLVGPASTGNGADDPEPYPCGPPRALRSLMGRRQSSGKASISSISVGATNSGVGDDEADDGEEAATGSASVVSAPSACTAASSSSSCASGAWSEEQLEAWAWTAEHDELSKLLRDGAALHGFVEAPLCFPPSFRWVRGARADYGAGEKGSGGAFEGCYTLHKKSEGAKGQRPPSYTDRVLLHSLPDLAADLVIDAYDVCEAMTGSDHRPVAATIRLTTSAEAAAAARAQVQAGALQLEHEVKITVEDPSYLPRKAALASKLRDWTGGGAAGRLLFQPNNYLAEHCTALVLHYPLAHMQPAALNVARRAEEMEEGLGIHAHRLSKENGGDGGGEGGGSEPTSSAGEGMGRWARYRRSVHEMPLRGGGKDGGNGSWRRDSGLSSKPHAGWSTGERSVLGLGLSHAIRAGVVGLPLYVLLRLQGKEPGQELGQGVICLREVLSRQQLTAEIRGGPLVDEEGNGDGDGNGHAAEDGGAADGVWTHVDICHGGVLVGGLQLRVRVSVRRIPQPPDGVGVGAEVDED